MSGVGLRTHKQTHAMELQRKDVVFEIVRYECRINDYLLTERGQRSSPSSVVRY